jgi:hypothetical protein
MPWEKYPDIWALLVALLISTVSGFISISRRILKGHTVSILWVTSEFSVAVLFGYLAWDSYSALSISLPEWLSAPIWVAVCSHSGGRIFQEIEATIVKRYARFFNHDDDLRL